MKLFGPTLRNLVTASAIACLSLGVYAEKIKLSADITAASEVPPKATPGHGTLTGTVDTDTDVFTYHITFEGLTGPAAAAHFHGPAMAGENAKPQLPIKVSPIAVSYTHLDVYKRQSRSSAAIQSPACATTTSSMRAKTSTR